MAAESLVRDICERYDVGPGYAAAYLEFFLQPGGRHSGRVFSSLDEMLALPAPDSIWLDYALSTNRRGRALADHLLHHAALEQPPRRVLDVGSGFGGLVAAFAERGAEVRGIDLDPDRVRLAEANCADHGVAGAITAGDILDERLVRELGTFDVISMIDVIEHVLDVPTALRHAASMLNPGGVLLLEIPNRESLHFIAADGHFGLFGITLLDREDAIAYHRALFEFAYDVGDYHDLATYSGLLREYGCGARTIPSPHHAIEPLMRVPALVTTIQRSLERYEETVAPKLPPRLRTIVQIRLSAYLTSLTADLARARAGDAQAFSERYLIDFWTLLATKACA